MQAVDNVLRARVSQVLAKPIYTDPASRLFFKKYSGDVKSGNYSELNERVVEVAKLALDDDVVDAVQIHSEKSNEYPDGLEVQLINFKPWYAPGRIEKDPLTGMLKTSNPLVQDLFNYVYSKGLDVVVRENTIYDSDDFQFACARIPPEWFKTDFTQVQDELALVKESEKDKTVIRVIENKALLKKYNIEPDKVSVVSRSNYLTPIDLLEINDKKELFLIKLLKAHEHSLKNRKLGTSKFSNRQYSTSMQLELKNGNDTSTFWVLAGNFEMNISELLCGERGGMTIAVNKAIDMLEKDLVDNLPDSANIENMLKVKRLVMTSSKELGEDKSAWQPCSDCYGWMGSLRFFSLDTQILSLGKDVSGNFTLEVRTLNDLLPKEDTHMISIITDEFIENVPIEYSPQAKRVVEENKLSEIMIRKMLTSAKNEYEKGVKINEGFSGKEAAASVLFHESRRIFTGKRVEWVPRWPEPADLVATIIGINELTKSGISNPTVKAIAHYSDHEEVPSIKSNGRLAQKRGGKDVVHIVLENNVIKVRIITDYQPFVHGSVRQLSSNRTTV